MKLLILMYHRARAGALGNSAEMLDAHFAWVARSYRNVLPGEALRPRRLNVCLTFDDGYFDFYAVVYPLLRKHGLRAVLAVPPALIRGAVDSPRADRLAMESDDALAHPSRGGCCTWGELQEMAASGLVAVAAHGFTHRRLDQAEADLATEIDVAKTALTRRLGRPVESFVFPYGRYSEPALARASERYRCVMRIGGALNRDWNQRLLYRVDADGMADPVALFGPLRMARYRMRYFWNRCRRR